MKESTMICIVAVIGILLTAFEFGMGYGIGMTGDFRYLLGAIGVGMFVPMATYTWVEEWYLNDKIKKAKQKENEEA